MTEKATCRISVADNAHYMDADFIYNINGFSTTEDAIVASKKIVDDDLGEIAEPGLSADAIYSRYTMFGRDPMPSNLEGETIGFSAWMYAKVRSLDFVK